MGYDANYTGIYVPNMYVIMYAIISINSYYVCYTSSYIY